MTQDATPLTAQDILYTLLNAFPTPGDWDRLVLFALNVNRATLTLGENLQAVALDVLRWAEAHGQLGELIHTAQTQNPDSPPLQALLVRWASQPAGITYFVGSAVGEPAVGDHALRSAERAPLSGPASDQRSTMTRKARACIDRGNTYYAWKDYAQARAEYNAAIELDPGLAEAYVYRGNTYYDLGEYIEALANYDQAIQVDPEYAIVYFFRSGTYRKLGRNAEANRDYARAIQLDPNLANAPHSFAERMAQFFKRFSAPRKQ
jgi:tetratricopeptide (TPR) repeat protein